MKKLFMIILLVLFASTAYASDVVFEWDTNDETDLKGYRVFQSDQAGIYDRSNPVADIDITDPQYDHTGDKFSYTLSGLADGTYYFIVTAYDTDGNMSLGSNEVVAPIDTDSPADPTNFIIKVIVKIVIP